MGGLLGHVLWLLAVALAAAQQDSGKDFTTNRRQNAQASDDIDPTSDEVLGKCSDGRASNYGANATGDTDDLCLYPVLRVGPNEWTSMPVYCSGGNFNWKTGDLADCYSSVQQYLPPWPRRYNCSDADCTLPLEIHVLNMMIHRLDFDVENNVVVLGLSYAIKWRDARIFGSILQDTSKVWTPEVRLDMLLSSRGDSNPLEVLEQQVSPDNMMIYVAQPQCQQDDLASAPPGQDLACCADGQQCEGRLVPFSDHVDCTSFDLCNVQAVRRMVVTARLRRLDMSKFPYDRHQLRINAYITNPYHSSSVDWWAQYRPKVPRLVFEDFGSGQPTTEGSLAFSLAQLRVLLFAASTSARVRTNTSLAHYMAQATNQSYQALLARAHRHGVGGIEVDVLLVRETAYIARFYAFPLVLVGTVACATPLLDDDAVNQISTRVGFGSIAILTALSSTLSLTATSSGSGDQLTAMDSVSIATIIFGGLVCLEALLSYAWWRKADCEADKLWTCWFVRAMDKTMAIWCVTLYLYLVGLLLLLPQNSTAALVWGVVGAVLVVAILAVGAYEVRRWARLARINPQTANLLGTTRGGAGSRALGLRVAQGRAHAEEEGKGNKLIAKTTKVISRAAVWR